MDTKINFKPGDQIVYIPDHADDPDHPDSEKGFVTSVTDKCVFCRYWNKYNPGQLRTIANSEATPAQNLIKMNTQPQGYINQLLKGIMSDEI